MPSTETRTEIKRLIIRALNLEGMEPAEINDEEPLFGDGLGLDSVDALELVVALERAYGVKIEGGDDTRRAFSTVQTLADFIEGLRTPTSDPVS